MAVPTQVKVLLPPAHDAQEILYDWSYINPLARVLVAPCGTKLGKSFGSAAWMTRELLTNPGIFAVWIAPTYRKAKIGYRYIKAMLPDCEWVNCVDGKLEIRLANGSFITFLHGRDAEVTVEGEAIDRFVIDESGKITEQVWHSLLTTITQTNGKGIVTGTPRGHTWYRNLYRLAKKGKDPRFIAVHLPTRLSPYVTAEAIAMAERMLPRHLYLQYYEAQFISQSTVFGDLEPMWDSSVSSGSMILSWGLDGPKEIESKGVKFWLHPDGETRKGEIVHGVDLAKQKDYTVFYSVNQRGQMVGYARFRKVPYKQVAVRFRKYLERFFEGCENIMRYDATGVGQSVGEHISEEFDDTDIDIAITPVTFTNKSKSTWVTDVIMAIESGWHRVPRIEEVESEYTAYEVNVTKQGNHSYSAPDGEHDDIVSAGLLAVSYGFSQARSAQGESFLEMAVKGATQHDIDDDVLAAYAEAVAGETDDDFFDGSEYDEILDFNEETA